MSILLGRFDKDVLVPEEQWNCYEVKFNVQTSRPTGDNEYALLAKVNLREKQKDKIAKSAMLLSCSCQLKGKTRKSFSMGKWLGLVWL